MERSEPAGSDWSRSEIDLIVADYFEMLALELAGQPYVKAHRNRALQDLIGRSHGSIEFKHQNISAVLIKLGMPWIYGYKPMPNFQGALIDGIERRLDHNFQEAPLPGPRSGTGLEDPSVQYLGPAPQLEAILEPTPAKLHRLVRKFDPALRDARNRALGNKGEERIYFSEQARLGQHGRPDLARKVRWVSQEDGDGAGFDILSFGDQGEQRLIEVKTTNGHETTPFWLSENERSLSVERSDAFRLVRLYDFARAPKGFELFPPLEASVLLQPANYRASFTS